MSSDMAETEVQLTNGTTCIRFFIWDWKELFHKDSTFGLHQEYLCVYIYVCTYACMHAHTHIYGFSSEVRTEVQLTVRERICILFINYCLETPPDQKKGGLLRLGFWEKSYTHMFSGIHHWNHSSGTGIEDRECHILRLTLRQPGRQTKLNLRQSC